MTIPQKALTSIMFILSVAVLGRTSPAPNTFSLVNPSSSEVITSITTRCQSGQLTRIDDVRLEDSVLSQSPNDPNFWTVLRECSVCESTHFLWLRLIPRVCVVVIRELCDAPPLAVIFFSHVVLSLYYACPYEHFSANMLFFYFMSDIPVVSWMSTTLNAVCVLPHNIVLRVLWNNLQKVAPSDFWWFRDFSVFSRHALVPLGCFAIIVHVVGGDGVHSRRR